MIMEVMKRINLLLPSLESEIAEGTAQKKN